MHNPVPHLKQLINALVAVCRYRAFCVKIDPESTVSDDAAIHLATLVEDAASLCYFADEEAGVDLLNPLLLAAGLSDVKFAPPSILGGNGVELNMLDGSGAFDACTYTVRDE